MKIRIGMQVDVDVMERWCALAAAAGQTRTQWLQSVVGGLGSDKRQYVSLPGRQAKDLASDATESSVGPQDIVVETPKTRAPAPAQAAASSRTFQPILKPRDSKRR